MKTDWIKTSLIVLSAAALALGILTAFVVFYPTGSYQPVVVQSTGTVSFSNLPSSTASSTSASSTTPMSTPTVPGGFASNYASPYPVTWIEGHETFSITGASSQGNQLTLSLTIQVGNVSECVPINLRLVADEFGTLKAPDSPDTQNCNGTPGATYSQSVVFAIDSSTTAPFLFTTGGTSNIFFNVATSTTGGVDIALPSHSG